MTDTAVQNEQLRKYVETHHIDMIPANARFGKPWHQLAFWAGANINVFNIVLGGVVVTIGLTFWWAVIAIAVGTMAGALLIALHATQGPKLGVPQTIQTRGQLGFYGAAFLFPAVLLLNVGFIAAQLVIEGQAGNAWISSISIPWWVVIIAIPASIIGILGYRWIHRTMQATVVVVGISMIVMLIQGVRYGSLPHSETAMKAPTAGLFLAGVALLVIDMLSWGPFVSDYTRYLPVDTNGKRLFWTIWLGNIVTTFISCTLGAYLTALLGSNVSPVAAIAKISGKWALVMLVLSLIGSDAVNAYTGGFQVLAFSNMFRRFKSVSIWLRVIPFLAVMLVGVIVGVIGYAHFVNNLSNFLDVLLVIFIPWSAVNIVDYFVVRRARYDVSSFFNPNGVYGKFAWRGLLAYAIGLGAEWPFVSQPDYTGPLVSKLGGADISWLVGWFVAALVYLLLFPASRETSKASHRMAATSAKRA
jgi:nucleobase:cation symporter-1, NCS1 family